MSTLSSSRSFFLFGPRGTGKSTLLEQWSQNLNAQTYDLLDPGTELKLSTHPELILEQWQADKTEWIVIDEIQKIPRLLDVVQNGISKFKIKFALTGSSARKLRRGSANLLGGRASEFHLHPFTHIELGSKFSLIETLTWGTLPEIVSLAPQEKIRALYSYVSTYLKEEVLVEQLIRKIEPFRKFLEVAAQMNGKILNYAKISKDTGVEERSVARYYQILDDTLVGFFLEPYDHSIRKRQSQKSKFYFFDCGVTRALQNQVSLALSDQTYSYGDLFEQFIFLECLRLNDYLEKRFKFSYLMTKDGLEIDLIIERPGLPAALIEIKSSKENVDEHSKSLISVAASFKKPSLYVFNNATKSKIKDGVKFINWLKGLKEVFEY
jgi:predicted AAA+ superfamily ATPase